MKEWRAPAAKIEMFAANEYVAACYAIVNEYEDFFTMTTAPTDGDTVTWKQKGFADDGLDYMGTNDIPKSGGWYYQGDKLTGTAVNIYCGTQRNYSDRQITQTANGTAVPVSVIEITEANYTKYSCGPNHS